MEFGKNGSAGITGALGAVPNFEIVGQVDNGLAGFGFGFLKAEDVRMLGIDKFLQGAFADDGAQAIDVPRVNSHVFIITLNLSVGNDDFQRFLGRL